MRVKKIYFNAYESANSIKHIFEQTLPSGNYYTKDLPEEVGRRDPLHDLLRDEVDNKKFPAITGKTNRKTHSNTSNRYGGRKQC